MGQCFAKEFCLLRPDGMLSQHLVAYSTKAVQRNTTVKLLSEAPIPSQLGMARYCIGIVGHIYSYRYRQIL